MQGYVIWLCKTCRAVFPMPLLDLSSLWTSTAFVVCSLQESCCLVQCSTVYQSPPPISLPDNESLTACPSIHNTVFCFSKVIGYRLRLHIDSYSECYDFWVNADSRDIRPAGWCESTGHQLHPPKGYNESEFNWEKYQEACNAEAAPKNLFKSQNGFQVGMKLEAVDRKNPCLVCVASVADIVDNHFLVHFDNWDDTYDYWCDASSPHIHPVGWCQDHGRPLTAPQGHPNPEHFLWEEYLQDNGSTAVPSQAFCMRAPHSFQVNMKLEAVDRRNPMLVRVATVSDTEDYRVKIHFDGWHEKFDFWVDSDLPDLHPVGWCARTGHPLEPPLSRAGPSDLKSSVTQGVCPTPGCRGVGHIKGAKYTGHHSAFGCPYSDINMKKEAVLPDRLGGEKQITFVPVHFVQKTKTLCTANEQEEATVSNQKRWVKRLLSTADRLNLRTAQKDFLLLQWACSICLGLAGLWMAGCQSLQSEACQV
uniref:L3MBTL histone methyl-lysine binding protein 4 n=1 Tax=Oncorhynchus tshawytscha TaxID=74940 RepID=A0AAZ3Q590_ONCTS